MTKTLTREQWGARPPKPGPGPLDPAQVIGMCLHWPAITKPLDGIDAVSDALRGWQRYHQDDKGWSDIAYQEAVDQDGNLYLLRGLQVQSGANGDERTNETYGSLLLVLAPGEHPTPAMTTKVRARIQRHRELFGRSTKIVGHSQIRPEPTACPGPILLDMIGVRRFEPNPPRNRVQRARAQIDRGLDLLAKVPAGSRPAVERLSRQMRTALKRMPQR